MQLSRLTDLGLRAMMRLAVGSAERERVTTRLIARQVRASERSVARVVAQLTELGLVAPQRGRAGGLRLTGPGREATVGWIARRLDGAFDTAECAGDRLCARGGPCQLRTALDEAREVFYRELDRYRIDDLVHRHIEIVPQPMSREIS